MGNPGAASASGQSIDNSGRVVGIVDGGAAIWDRGAFTHLLPLPGFAGAIPEKIGNTGKIVGWSYYSDSLAEHPTLWDAGRVTYLGNLPGYERGFAESINAFGQIVGWGEHVDNITNPDRAFLWNAGTLIDIGAAPGFSTAIALAFNDGGTIVGASGSGGYSRGTIWEDGVATNLNTRLAPESAGWRVKYAIDINNAGQIVGQAVAPNGVTRAVLLNPVPEPSSFGFLVLSALMMGWLRPRSLRA